MSLDKDSNAGIYENDNGERCINIKEIDLNVLHPQNVNDVKKGAKWVIVGKPGTGKSTLIETIMYYKAHIFPVVQVFSGTELSNNFYGPKCPRTLIYDDLDSKSMENFAKRQQIAMEYLPNPWALQILDDCSDDPKILGKAPFPAYYKKGRHWRMLHMLALQYPMDIKPSIRTCVDVIFLLANSVLAERKKLYENFGAACIPSFDDFCDIMDTITENKTALVINNMSESNKLEDRLFYFKANPDIIPKNFRMCCPEAYECDAERYDPNYSPIVL